MPKHGSIILYIQGNQKVREDGQLRTATSTLTQLLNYGVLVPGHGLLTFFFLSSFLFFDWVEVLWSCWASRALFSPVSLQKQVVLSCCLGTHVSDSGESLHCFLVAVSKSYVIATSDL